MVNFLKKWFGEWMTDEEYQAKLNAEYDAEMARITATLDAKRKIAIERLGEKWLMHPKNAITRKNATRIL